MILIPLIGGPLGGQVREVPAEWLNDGRVYISFMPLPEFPRCELGVDVIPRPVPVYEYKIHRKDGYVSLRYGP